MPKAVNILKRSLGTSWLQLALLCLVPIIIYSNTLGVPFLFDDEASIQLNPAMHGLAAYFSDWAGYRFLPNRALGYLSFALNYQFGGLDVTGYHLVNLAIHSANGLLVYALSAGLLRTPGVAGGEPGDDRGSETAPATTWLPFAVALLFVCHPLQTQAVTYVVQRLTSLATLFYLVSLVCYLRWRLSAGTAGTLPPLRALPWYLLSLAAALCAMKTKEIAFTLPFLVLLCELMFFGRPGARQLAALGPMALTALIIPVTTYGSALKSSGGVLSDVSSATVVASPLSRWEYLCTQFSAIVSYLRLLVLPVGQSLDHSYPVNNSLGEPRALFGLCVLCALLTTALLCWRAGTGRGSAGAGVRGCYRLAAFGILWFFATISIESSIIPIADVMVEHRVYLPSFGFFLALSALLLVALARLEGRLRRAPQVAAALLVAAVLLLSGVTYARNEVWRDWLTIWGDTVRKNPDNARAHNILGIGFLYRKQFEAALPEFEKAVQLKPQYTEAYFNLGMALRNLERHADSLAMYRRVLSLGPRDAKSYAQTYSEIGVNCALMGNLDGAIAAFSSAVTYDPEFVEYRNNYAHAMLDQGQVGAAAAEFRKVLRLDPGNQRAREMLQQIEALQSQGAPHP